MSMIDLGVILLFTILVVGCGLSFSSSGKNMKSFYSAGGALPWWMSGLSLFMSFFSAGTFVVWGSIAYSAGWVAVMIQWTMCIAGLIVGCLIAPRWRQANVLTAAQFIKERVGLRVQKIYTAIFLTIATFSTGAFLYPIGKMVEVSTGISLSAVIIGIGLLILLYTAVGGLWAVIVTDILQFVVLTAAVIIVVPLALDRVDGFSGFIQGAPEGFFNLTNEEYSWGFLFAFGLYNLFFIAGNWAYVQRYTCVEKTRDAKKVGWLFSILYLVSPLVWMIAPMIYRTINPELGGNADEGAYLLMCKEVLPMGMLGLMLGGMIFATSSSINSALNITSGVITNDVFKVIYPNSEQKTLVRFGRIITVLLGLITISIALLVPYMGGVVEVVMTLAALTGGALYLPPVWLLFSKYQTGKSILITSGLSLTINLVFKFVTPTLFGLSLGRAEEMLLGVLGPVVILSLFEIKGRLTGRVSASYEAYQQIVKQKAEQESQEAPAPAMAAEKSDNHRGIMVIGLGVTSIGAIMLGLAIIASHGQYVVGIVALITTLIGAAITLNGRSNAKRVKQQVGFDQA
ncbi:sodium:solute symporter family protein [Vibrio sp. WXL210]|uniref:sodium:solute symporter family protein n=1 Tax=Vibrio sp. WXL210 TaxID=3450709 RepID=UPI003EC714E2